MYTMAAIYGRGLWTNYIAPCLIESGAINSPMAADTGTIQRLRWLILVVQFGPCFTQQYGLELANDMLLAEDLSSDYENNDNDYAYAYALGSDDAQEPMTP